MQRMAYTLGTTARTVNWRSLATTPTRAASTVSELSAGLLNGIASACVAVSCAAAMDFGVDRLI